MQPRRYSFRKARKTKITLTLCVILAVALLAGRMYLPVWATRYVNQQIANLDGYGGGVQDIDIALWRGAYQIHGLEIHKTNGGIKKPFVAAEMIDLSIEWKALLKGRVVAEATLNDINFTFAKSQTGKGGGWGKLIDALTPVDINRLEIHGGKVSYIDYEPSPDVNIYITGVEGLVTNLRNVENKNATLPSVIQLSGTSIGKGRVSLTGTANILREIPDFDANFKLENADLTAFNEYTRAALAVDFEKGTASIYSEMASSQGHVTGYIKAIANDVSVIDLSKDDSNPINAIWETLVAGFMEIFRNHGNGQFAFRIPVEGRVDNLERDSWSAFFSIFKNAFGKAFPRDTDGNINFADALKEGAKE